MGMFSAPFAHNLDVKTVELSAKRIMQGRSKCFDNQNG